MPRLPRLAWGGLAAWVGLVVLQHATRTDLDPEERFVSEYAVGDGGWVQVVAFAGWALSLAVAAVLVARARATPRRAVARGVLVATLAVAAAGAVLCGAFESQTIGGELPEGVVRTTAGRLHDVGSLLLFAGLLVAAIAHARASRDRATTLATAALAASLFLIPTAMVVAGWDAPGVGQRAFIAVGCLWQASLLRRVARP